MTQKTANHYVSQFYLRYWCADDGKLWVHPNDGSDPFRSTPKSFATEKGLYDTSAFPDIRHWNQEGDLSAIEHRLALVWPHIFEHIGDARTKTNLAKYLALTWLRHPNRKDQVRSINRSVLEMVSRVPSDQKEVTIRSGGEDKLFQLAEVREKSADTDGNTNEQFLQMMRTALPEVARVLNSRKWAVFESSAAVFATGDAPLVLWRGKTKQPRYGLRTPGTQISFALTPNKLLMISDELEADGLIYPVKDIGNINTGVVSAASRFVFSCDKKILGAND